MELAEDVGQFRTLLSAASASIEKDYFMLPVSGANDGKPIVTYRERVYAYELYHRLRCLWPKWEYSLGGEVDKSGNPRVHGPNLDNAKPDLLVHVPGEMTRNLVVMEIKAAGPTVPDRRAITTDLKKLAAFCTDAQYHAGLLLVFGKEITHVRKHAAWAEANGVCLRSLELWHHSQPGVQAHKVLWANGST